MEAFLVGLPTETLVFITILFIWSIIWKGLALWKSARLSQKWWFIIFLFINTAGLLEIIYLYIITKGYSVTVEERDEKVE